MSKNNNQNAAVYKDITESGKSLLQLYIEVKDERDKLIARLVANRIIGRPYNG
jgi:hypothetical protein